MRSQGKQGKSEKRANDCDGLPSQKLNICNLEAMSKSLHENKWVMKSKENEGGKTTLITFDLCFKFHIFCLKDLVDAIKSHRLLKMS